jgi:hypothetical protein
VDLCEF